MLQMMEERIVRLRITGVVQGVGFRAFVENAASRAGACGWVRNRRDHSVEAVIAGTPETVGEMIVACRRGPPGSSVEAVDMEAADAADLAEGRPGGGFSVLPTI
jgi:acylphosphatase